MKAVILPSQINTMLRTSSLSLLFVRDYIVNEKTILRNPAADHQAFPNTPLP